MNWWLIAWLAGLTVAVIAVEWRYWFIWRPAQKLITEETKRKAEHTKAFERLTDPEAIASDFEQSAKAMEARNANRVIEPREDAGPHAIVHRVRKMRPKTPTRWNPPADYSDRVRFETNRRNRGQ